MKSYALLKNIPAPRKLSKQELFKTVSELSAQIACSKARCVWIVQSFPTRPRSQGRLTKSLLHTLGL